MEKNRNLKIVVEYDGTNFHGWQTQTPKVQKPGHVDSPFRTVQEELKRAIKLILKEDVNILGSGRTDTGVHAAGQVANFKTSSQMPLERMRTAINANLPIDVAIVSIEEVPSDFHAQYSAIGKTYRYTILNRAVRPVINRGFCLYVDMPLSLSKMRKEAKSFIGEKDFKSFAATPSRRDKKKRENTIRTIKNLIIKKKNDVVTIDIEATGFLQRMVRNIVGTLIDVGTGKLPLGSVEKILAKKNRVFASMTVKPHGLTLMRVFYPKLPSLSRLK